MIDYDLYTVINVNSNRDSLEGKITLNEVAMTLKNMSNNKSPGSEGFTSEFIKMLWKDL